jgi:hypothetical protein
MKVINIEKPCSLPSLILTGESRAYPQDIRLSKGGANPNEASYRLKVKSHNSQYSNLGYKC